jgi:hypothetical protein
MAEKDSVGRCLERNKSRPAHVKSGTATAHFARGHRVPASIGSRALIRRHIMTVSRFFSAVCMVLALAFGSFATVACAATPDNGASGTSGNTNSGGGGY